MTLSTAQRLGRIGALQAKLKARRGNPAFRVNCEQIQDEITRLQDLNAAENLGSEENGAPE